MWFGVFSQRSRSSGCSAAAAAGSRASIGSLCSQVKLLLTVFGKHFAYFSMFWHLLRGRSAEGKTTFVPVLAKTTDGNRAGFFHPRYSHLLF